ncbi:MAG TPA: ABC transporter permease [Pyrinomonadaceae bacterium]
MTKFLAIVKREYTQRVRARMFIVTTVLLPAAMLFFGLAPALMMTIGSGNPLRVAVIDGTGKLLSRVQDSLAHDKATGAIPNGTPNQGSDFGRENFVFEEVKPGTRSLTDVTAELDQRLRNKEIDAYLILPPDLMETGKARLYRRNSSEIFSRGQLQDALDDAVRQQRLTDAHVDAKTLSALQRPVAFETTRITAAGNEHDSGASFPLVFGFGFLMYISVLLYGQVVLGAVIEEKETRIAEILFSSVRPFTLMMGKLVGVSLVALTQLAIWGVAFAGFGLYGINLLASRGVPARLPNIPLSFYLYFVLFFLAGYFVYSTLYALVGSIVTTAQEGGQVAMPIIILLVISFYLFFPVSKNPDSTLSFWLSMVPLFSPISMLIRIVTQTPPLWQIALSLLFSLAFGTLLTWVASRIYRIGMLMYGKRPTIPELVRWVRSQ